MSQQIRIGFDARLAGSRHAGIGRYSEELLRRMVARKTHEGRQIHWKVWVFARHDLSWLDQVGDHVEVCVTDIRHYTLSEQTRWWWELHTANLDLLYVPHFNVPLLYRKPFIMTLHDLLWHTQKDLRATTLSPLMYVLKRSLYRLVSEQAIRAAQSVLVPSQVVAHEVRTLVGRVQNVVVVPEGVPKLFESAPIVSPQPQKVPYAVYTGSLYPHKNFEVILQALRMDGSLHLKVVGARNVFVEQLQKRAKRLGVQAQITWLGYQTDEKVIALYQDAVALIQPSRAEGFGLTGLEALAVGCPVLVSDIPVFREVYGKKAEYFLPDNPEALVHLWQKLQKSPPTLEQRRVLKAYTKHFSWDNLAQEVWRQCAEVL